ncbi:hypothetical protein MOQ14_03205 [Stenotrophomonas maltophilia]|uniref:hypothetical protein n=1 Tax=Stenotrophomonas maltophilia TaxID=40324 RepID=UPI001312860C|nr:hypothetical protein [Stenotrophomonas maltophilia]MCI1137569.1 hypothetical protein [Stenotrophomonas maltophilia]
MISTQRWSLQYRLIDTRRSFLKGSADAGMGMACESLVFRCALENQTVHGTVGYFGAVEFASIRSAQMTTGRSMLDLG